MKKRNILLTLICTVVFAVAMAAAAQFSYALDPDVSATYIPADSSESVTLGRIQNIYLPWKPGFSDGDVLIVKNGGSEKKYVYDKGVYKGRRDVSGFYDDDGVPMTDEYRCLEYKSSLDETKVYSFCPQFEWSDGRAPETSGQTAYYRLCIYAAGSEDDAEPLAYTNDIPVYIQASAEIDGIYYVDNKDGSANADSFMEYDADFEIKEQVALDDGKTYTVKHIDECFCDCECIKRVIIPDSITTISAFAFFNTPELKEVTIPPGVTSIGKYAFGYYGKHGFFSTDRIDGKIEDFVIYAKTGSEGARYAVENGFRYIDLDEVAREQVADEAYAKAKAAAAEAARNTPAKAKITKLIKGRRMLTVRWKKIPKASGYEIRYSTDKNFKKGVKTAKVKKYKNKGVKLKKLKKNKTWYVQIRAYRNAGGKTYCGKWSAAKHVKVR